MEWININDDLPEEGLYVILNSKVHGVMMGYLYESIFNDFEGLEFDEKDITHWMYLPEPPK